MSKPHCGAIWVKGAGKGVGRVTHTNHSAVLHSCCSAAEQQCLLPFSHAKRVGFGKAAVCKSAITYLWQAIGRQRHSLTGQHFLLPHRIISAQRVCAKPVPVSCHR